MCTITFWTLNIIVIAFWLRTSWCTLISNYKCDRHLQLNINCTWEMRWRGGWGGGAVATKWESNDRQTHIAEIKCVSVWIIAKLLFSVWNGKIMRNIDWFSICIHISVKNGKLTRIAFGWAYHRQFNDDAEVVPHMLEQMNELNNKQTIKTQQESKQFERLNTAAASITIFCVQFWSVNCFGMCHHGRGPREKSSFN